MPGRSHVLFVALLLICVSAAAQTPRLDVEITGVAGDLLENVRANLELYQQRDHPLLGDALIRRLHGRAGGEIRQALEPFGYYRARVDGTLTRTGQGWRAHYAIDPGEPIRLREVTITLSGDGASDPELKRWREDYPLRENNIPLHNDYENAKQELLRIARERGYIEGGLIENRILIDLDRYRASIVVRFETGPRYVFGDIRFVQQEFDETLLRGYLPFRDGDPYDASKLLELRRVLANSDYFEDAEVIALTDQTSEHRIPVRVELVARKPARYSAGIGYATDTGARGMLGYEKRRANSSGHRYNFVLRRSEIDASAIARYRIPLQRPATDSLTYHVSWIDENTDTLQRYTTSTGVDLNEQKGRWLRSIGLSYELERYRLGNDDDSTLLIPRIGWERASTTDRILAREGWLFGIEFRGAYDELFSDTSFLQARSDSKYIHALGDRRRLLLRSTLGGTVTPELIDLPASQRFLAGGDQSIRGYAYNSLGPTNADGEVIGGKHLLVGSVEVEQDIRGNFGLALFLDAGNAFDAGDFDVQRGAGFGLRWRSPIGAIRVDLAQALDKDGNPWRLHLTVGPDL
ncbi:MAG: outer membrane protein assembly factor [Gammaproteobacteria bacterium]|nr:outer membrane protein assembly factor [Gammaproteobacteria bacterium]